MYALGTHILLDLERCNVEILKSTRKIHSIMLTAARKAGATIVKKAFHQFKPYGVSGMVVIAESHLSIHTWPEYEYAAVDIFVCGNLDVDSAEKYLIKRLASKQHHRRKLKRGISKKSRPHKPT